VSYCAGAHGTQRGPWYAGLDAMFGVEHQLSYGLVDPIEDEEVVVTFVRDFGSIPEGSRLEFRAAGWGSATVATATAPARLPRSPAGPGSSAATPRRRSTW